MPTSFMSPDFMLQDCSYEQSDSVPSIPPAAAPKPSLSYLEFFAGSGLVAEGLKDVFKPVWANDIDAKKAAVYTANHSGKHFHLGSIADVKGSALPVAQLAWASFPCQDLSLAGLAEGIHGKRSGLVWEWLHVIDEMPEPPPFLVAENVLGLVSSSGGAHYRTLHEALVQRGYRVGAMLIDAVHFLPQSRPRIFVVAIKRELAIPAELERATPSWCHPDAVRKAAVGLEDWVWWDLPQPNVRVQPLSDIIDFGAAYSGAKAEERTLGLISPKHADFLNAIPEHELVIAPGYKRMRGGKQVLELRFDNVAGCLRTPSGGSSRQVLVIRENGKLQSRLLTVRETARLMGAPDTYKIPGTYTDGYKAMGDAVAVPVAKWLATKLLSPLANANAPQHKP